MPDAPERIWITNAPPVGGYRAVAEKPHFADATEYVRTDVRLAERAELLRQVEALAQEFHEQSAQINRLRTALTTARDIIKDDRQVAYDSYTLDGRIKTADEGELAHLRAYDDALAAIGTVMERAGDER